MLLVAGGSGVVPLMAMVRAHAAAGSKVPFRLIYSVRTPADAIYAPELSERAVASALDVTYLYTRAAPPGERTGRIDAGVIAETAWSPSDKPEIFICGPTGFVEAAAGLSGRGRPRPGCHQNRTLRPDRNLTAAPAPAPGGPPPSNAPGHAVAGA